MKVVSVEHMRSLDQRTIREAGIPGHILMERAGVGAGEHILDFISSLDAAHVKRFVLLAGKGNNGGDAYVIARFLSQKTDVEIIVFSICPKQYLKGDALLNAERLPSNVFFESRETLTSADLKEGDIIIDGLLGTGAKGPLRAPYDTWIAAVNKSRLPVVSLDIPSGLNGDDGSVATDAIVADMTISMGYPKKGFISGEGPNHCGRLRNVEIGIPKTYVDAVPSDVDMVFSDDIRPCLGRLAADTHKNRRGRLLIIGGSRDYRGAPILSALAALRSGCGLVFLATPKSADIRTDSLHSLILRQIPDKGNGYFDSTSIRELRELASTMDAVAVGPGLSNGSELIKIIDMLNSLDIPVLYDADALNLIASEPSVFDRQAPSLLTPHPGEAKRLVDALKLKKDATRLETADLLASAMRSTVILKGQYSVIASYQSIHAINSSGCPALATAGSGDVLTGIAGAFLAAGMNPCEAAKCAAFIHGLAGECSLYGQRGLIADDLPNLIPVAMKKISPFA